MLSEPTVHELCMKTGGPKFSVYFMATTLRFDFDLACRLKEAPLLSRFGFLTFSPPMQLALAQDRYYHSILLIPGTRSKW